MPPLTPALASEYAAVLRQTVRREALAAGGLAGGGQRPLTLSGLAGLAGKPGFQLPVVGPVLGDLAAGDNDLRVPVEGVLVGEQRRFDPRPRRMLRGER